MSCRRATHVTFPIPSTKPARTILKFSPDFRAETSVNKHVNSEMNPPHTRGEMTATVRPTVYPGTEAGFPWCETARSMTQPRASKSQVTKSIWRGQTARQVYICRGYFMFSYSPTCFLPPTLTGQAVRTPQPCGSRHENLNKTPTEI